MERGVRFVTVFNPGWDTHDNLVVRLKEGYAGARVGVGLIPTCDQAFAALVMDLDDRGLLDDTLVMALGEFGRTANSLLPGGQGYAAIINADTLQPRCELSGHTRAILSAAWLSQDTALTAGVDSTILLWNTVTAATQRSLNQHTDAVQSIIVQPQVDGKQSLVATIGADCTVRFWQPNIGRMVSLARLDSRPTAAVWSANGEVIHIACWDGRVRTVRAEDAELLHEAKAIDGVAYAIDMAPDGDVVVAESAGQLTRLQKQ